MKTIGKFIRLLAVAIFLLGVLSLIGGTIEIWNQPLTMSLRFNTYWPGAALIILAGVLYVTTAFYND